MTVITIQWHLLVAFKICDQIVQKFLVDVAVAVLSVILLSFSMFQAALSFGSVLVFPACPFSVCEHTLHGMASEKEQLLYMICSLASCTKQTLHMTSRNTIISLLKQGFKQVSLHTHHLAFQ